MRGPADPCLMGGDFITDGGRVSKVFASRSGAEYVGKPEHSRGAAVDL